MAVEEEIYLGMCRRWRNIPKPTIAQVQGKCIAGGLMLAWVCDLIVASDDAMFSDPVVQMGVCGVEYFAHPWELGARKAKEMLFTADWVTAEEAHRLGMVNHVVPRDELESFTLALAQKIAEKPSFALKLAKEAVNQTLEAQGQWQAMLAVFNLHQLAHAHNQELFGMRIDPTGIPGAVRRNP
jgi:enoyl-CoA hydratase